MKREEETFVDFEKMHGKRRASSAGVVEESAQEPCARARTNMKVEGGAIDQARKSSSISSIGPSKASGTGIGKDGHIQEERKTRIKRREKGYDNTRRRDEKMIDPSKKINEWYKAKLCAGIEVGDVWDSGGQHRKMKE